MTKEQGDTPSRRKPGPKHWTLSERLGGLLPADSRSEGNLSFPLRALYRGKAFQNTPSGMDSSEKRERSLNLNEEQKWALDCLTEELRDALVCGDSKKLHAIAAAIDYRKKVSDRNDSLSASENLEYRLLRYALEWKHNAPNPMPDGPDRRETKKRVIDDLIKEEEARIGTKMTDAQRREMRAQLTKILPWTKTFEMLGKYGYYLIKGKAGAPKKF